MFDAYRLSSSKYFGLIYQSEIVYWKNVQRGAIGFQTFCSELSTS